MTDRQALAKNASLEREGYQYFAKALGGEIGQLETLVARFDQGSAGTRIADSPELARWLEFSGPLRSILLQLFPAASRPVRAILFDKSPDQNWALAWHQDRTICVRGKADVAGFGPYSVKHGLVHVEPPFGIIERMRTLRIHLDPVAQDNAPLIVAAGSHKLGRIASRDVADVARRSEHIACLADRGDVWAYSTPILHMSERSGSGARRRVLQVDYSSDELPEGLQWFGIGGSRQPH